MPATESFTALADERFVSLTTFRKSGEPVSTPVWIARDGEDLIVTTPRESGKVKRLRNDQRIEMRPCTRMGRVADDADTVAGIASIADDERSRRLLTSVFGRKYGLEYRIFMLIERLGRSGRQERVLLRVTPS
ncbi:PPOX class F420-dependent oxidoreductase [Glaciibacter sp. 2TAF33]|uniref:PPOX class F420-dependent oxidoreductase n=1 Tax=Glaciibacter sp. 2TAF33 TaxID=3233015 RepID=UPI003F8E79B7